MDVGGRQLPRRKLDGSRAVGVPGIGPAVLVAADDQIGRFSLRFMYSNIVTAANFVADDGRVRAAAHAGVMRDVQRHASGNQFQMPPAKHVGVRVLLGLDVGGKGFFHAA